VVKQLQSGNIATAAGRHLLRITPDNNKETKMLIRLILSGVILAGLTAGPVLALEANTKAAISRPYRAINPATRKSSGSERSIIIVGGKNSKPASVGSTGSKVMLNPQPLPPRTR
jgi:hypothetical protein